MASDRMPVNPAIVTWAREYAGYKLQDFRDNVSLSKIADWESGLREPTYRQVELMASKFKVPVAAFLLSEAPQLPPIEATFRTLNAQHFGEIPPRIRLLIRKAKAFQLGLEQLNDGHNPSPKLITRDLKPLPSDSVETIAKRVREYLDIAFQEQFSWKTTDTALKTWRKIFLDAGIYVFKDAFGKKLQEYSGFCLFHPEFPIIYVNNSNTKTRQIFTLFHELAHLLFQTSGIDSHPDSYVDKLSGENRKIEIICNRMAASTLVPDKVFDKTLDEEFGGKENIIDYKSSTEILAKKFSVSREVIYRRFLDRGAVSQSEYRQATQEWSNQQQPRISGGNIFQNWITYLGREYIALAFEKYYQNRISFEELGDYLDIKPYNLNKLEELLAVSKI